MSPLERRDTWNPWDNRQVAQLTAALQALIVDLAKPRIPKMGNGDAAAKLLRDSLSQ